MGLETGTYIDSLNSSNPTAGDAVSEGDDHLRLIKSTVKATFPNLSNAVTSTHTELNLLDGVTANTTELNYVDVTTLGTVQASKAVTADASKDVTGFRNLTLTASSGADHTFVSSGTTNLVIGADENNEVASSNLIFNVDGTERMRLDSSGNLKFNSGYGSVVTAYGPRAWVNFNGSGTPAARASGGVSSIGDRGTGMFTVNLSVTTPDVNGAVVATSSNNDTASSSEDTNVIAVQNSTSALYINLEDSSTGAQKDDAYINVVYMR